MYKLIWSQDKQIKPHCNVKHNPFANSENEHEITKAFSQESKVKNAEKLYINLNFEEEQQLSDQSEFENDEWDWPNQIQFEGMMYSKGIWTRDHMIHNIHIYYCADKERIKCEGTLLYYSDSKIAKIKAMHSKILDDHKIYKIQNAIENKKCNTKFGSIKEFDTRELEQIICHLTMQNKYLTSSHIMSAINSNYLWNKSLINFYPYFICKLIKLFKSKIENKGGVIQNLIITKRGRFKRVSFENLKFLL